MIFTPVRDQFLVGDEINMSPLILVHIYSNWTVCIQREIFCYLWWYEFNSLWSRYEHIYLALFSQWRMNCMLKYIYISATENPDKKVLLGDVTCSMWGCWINWIIFLWNPSIHPSILQVKWLVVVVVEPSLLINCLIPKVLS